MAPASPMTERRRRREYLILVLAQGTRELGGGEGQWRRGSRGQWMTLPLCPADHSPQCSPGVIFKPRHLCLRSLPAL